MQHSNVTWIRHFLFLLRLRCHEAYGVRHPHASTRFLIIIELIKDCGLRNVNWGLRADGGRLRIEVVENGSNDYNVTSGNVILNDKHNTVVGSRQFLRRWPYHSFWAHWFVLKHRSLFLSNWSEITGKNQSILIQVPFKKYKYYF